MLCSPPLWELQEAGQQAGQPLGRMVLVGRGVLALRSVGAAGSDQPDARQRERANVNVHSQGLQRGSATMAGRTISCSMHVLRLS